MYNKVLYFWFNELQPSDWFKKDITLDNKIKNRFENLFDQAICGELSHWRESIEGRLAEIIILDQFSRNIYRDKPEAFKYDYLALALSQEASKLAEINKLSTIQKSFLYMPFMHSESLKIHDEAMKLFSEPGLEMNLDFEIKHKVIIEKFGRYPHRNAILGRNSTPAEVEFLKGPNSSF